VSPEQTVRQMIAYTIPVAVLGVVFGPVAGLGWFYLVTSVLAGAVFVWHTIALRGDLSPRRAMKVFGYSITYVTLVFAAMAVDVFITFGV
jgi:heme o synthase